MSDIQLTKLVDDYKEAFEREAWDDFISVVQDSTFNEPVIERCLSVETRARRCTPTQDTSRGADLLEAAAVYSDL